jgi:hypothetical protein
MVDEPLLAINHPQIHQKWMIFVEISLKKTNLIKTYPMVLWSNAGAASWKILYTCRLLAGKLRK